MARIKAFTLVRRWAVAVASITFIMLASLTDSSAATDRAFRWIGDPRRTNDVRVVRHEKPHREMHVRISPAATIRAAPLSQAHPDAPANFGYGVGDNSKNMSW